MRLPNAPLVEVVFEIHWEIVKTSPEGGPVVFGYDPEFVKFETNFDRLMLAAGFSRESLLQPGPTIAHAIVNRYRKGTEPFPIVQIGHGIFACNVSTDYEWEPFKQFAIENAQRVVDTYPDLKVSRLELRYIDLFNADMLQHNSITEFLKSNSSVKYDGFAFLESALFEGEDQGMLSIRKPLANKELGYFTFEIANAASEGKIGLLLVSRVVKEKVSEQNFKGDILTALGSWLGDAHDVTSPFFRAFVHPDLMKQFS